MWFFYELEEELQSVVWIRRSPFQAQNMSRVTKGHSRLFLISSQKLQQTSQNNISEKCWSNIMAFHAKSIKILRKKSILLVMIYMDVESVLQLTLKLKRFFNFDACVKIAVAFKLCSPVSNVHLFWPFPILLPNTDTFHFLLFILS